MLFNEKYGISHISYNSGRITVDFKDESTTEELEAFEGLIRGFSRLIGDERESMGMMQYRIRNSPHDFSIQWEAAEGIVITVENMRKIDEIVRFIRESIQEINYNMLYVER